jgi:hypothetical protein
MAGIRRVISFIMLSASILKVAGSVLALALVGANHELVVPTGVQNKSTAPLLNDLARQAE